MSEVTFFSVLSDVSVVIGAAAAIYGVNTWKREMQWRKKTDLAEKALHIIYDVESAIRGIRSPLSYGYESEGRVKGEDETPRECQARDQAQVVFSRIKEHVQKFDEMRVIRQRCRVLFGDSHVSYFDDLRAIVIDIRVAAEMLGDHYWQEEVDWMDEAKKAEHIKAKRENEDVIWYRGSRDKIEPKVSAIVATAEGVFRELIEPPSFRQCCLSCWEQFKAWCENRLG